MLEMRDNWGISIDVTSRCNRRCANCTRGMRHVSHNDESLQKIERALRSLRGYRGGVVCIGGEPTLHTHYQGICKLWRKYVPKSRAALWYGRKITEPILQEETDATFGTVSYNDHHGGSWHQPIYVVGADIGLSRSQIDRNISRCWMNYNWSPTIAHGKGYFCQVAALMDHLLGWGFGFDLVDGWWKRPVGYQRYLCQLCGIPHNLPPVKDTCGYEYMSSTWIGLMKPRSGYVEVKSREDFRESGVYRHYAVEDGVHYWTKRTPQMWLRMKRAGLAYRLRKTAWRMTDALLGD